MEVLLDVFDADQQTSDSKGSLLANGPARDHFPSHSNHIALFVLLIKTPFLDSVLEVSEAGDRLA